MLLSENAQMSMASAMGLARSEGFIFVAIAWNEHDGSIQFMNNDMLSRAAVQEILETVVEQVRDPSQHFSKTEPPNLTIGEA